jgi:hypothetical protein
MGQFWSAMHDFGFLLAYSSTSTSTIFGCGYAALGVMQATSRSRIAIEQDLALGVASKAPPRFRTSEFSAESGITPDDLKEEELLMCE